MHCGRNSKMNEGKKNGVRKKRSWQDWPMHGRKKKRNEKEGGTAIWSLAVMRTLFDVHVYKCNARQKI